MPIIVACPRCATKLSAPDDAAGRQVRCPRPNCGAVAQVPVFLAAEEVAVVDAVAVPPRPVRAVEDEDDPPRRKRRRDDVDADERPRRRAKRRARSGGATAALGVVAAILGVLVALGGIGYGIYALVSKEGDTAKKDTSGGDTGGGLNTGGSGVKAPVPTGWVLHTSTNGKFKAYFPKSPSDTTTSSNGLSVNMVMTGGPRERLAVIVVGIPIPPQAAGVNRDQLAEYMRQGIMQKQGKARVVSQRSVTWSGRPALEMTLESSNKKALVVMRQLVTDTGMYFAFFACSTGPSPDEENGFFDNFELLK
jgi:hypothetical protein